MEKSVVHSIQSSLWHFSSQRRRADISFQPRNNVSSTLAPFGGGFSLDIMLRPRYPCQLLMAMTTPHHRRTIHSLHFSAQQVVLGIHYSIETLTAPVKLFHVCRLNSHITVSLIPSSLQLYNTNPLRALWHPDVPFIDHAVHLHCQPSLRFCFGFHADWPCTGHWPATTMRRYGFISINLVPLGANCAPPVYTEKYNPP